MDAELSLDSTISGSASDVSVNGRADIVRGRFELLGKRFSFQDSDIIFSGDPLAAKLDILAVRQADDFLAKVSISGTPLRPEVSLDAEPSLPEDEVLSRVLFGRSPSQLTGLEAARLAAALAQMSGGSGFDLMGGIEQIAGLDTLDVSQDASGQFQVATGRYLSEDVYLEVTSNASGAPGVSVEWEPRDNVSIGAETVPGEGQSLSIQWKKDFE
jgi:autotransporter translocation and assembly factor TamB